MHLSTLLALPTKVFDLSSIKNWYSMKVTLFIDIEWSWATISMLANLTGKRKEPSKFDVIYVTLL